jgi:hypothetical protein
MATATGQQLADNIRKRLEEMVKACEGVSEDVASRAPEGRWSPKEILSHILGPEEPGLVSGLRSFLEADTPTIDLEAENPFFSERRARMTFDQLLSEVKRVYGEISDFAAGLTPGELDRKAHIPNLKETELGEYPTLEAMIGGLLDYHLQFHTDHMKEILEALRKK